MKHIVITTISLLIVATFQTGLARAAEYRFSVPKVYVNVDIDTNGTAKIHYTINFKCAAGIWVDTP